MIQPGDVLDLGPLDSKFHIKRTGAETDGDSLDMEWELGPETGGTPVHIHPHASESYEVIEGELDVYVKDGWRTLKPGDRVVVEAGVPHTFRNSSSALTRVYNVHRPALRFGEYFYRLDKVVNSGAVSSKGMTPRALLHLSILITSYPREVRPTRPPFGIMKALALIGRLLGYERAQAKWMSGWETGARSAGPRSASGSA